MSMNSPVWRIAAATGESLDDVEAGLKALGLKGYTFDDIWTLLRGAINSGMTVTELARIVGDKA